MDVCLIVTFEQTPFDYCMFFIDLFFLSDLHVCLDVYPSLSWTFVALSRFVVVLGSFTLLFVIFALLCSFRRSMLPVVFLQTLVITILRRRDIFAFTLLQYSNYDFDLSFCF